MCLGSQKDRLRRFLTALESSDFHILDRRPENSDSQDISEKELRELSREVQEMLQDLPPRNTHTLSQNIIDAVQNGPDGDFNRLRRALELAKQNSFPIKRDASRQNSDDPQTRILITSEDAFDCPYYPQQALAAFIEYLDVQWVNMRQHHSDSTGGTCQSRCGTITQSSCTGKSRLMNEFASKIANDQLIYRLGKKILVPNVSFQASTDNGTPLGFPHRVCFRVLSKLSL